MKQIKTAITNALAGKIYQQLIKKDYGEFPYKNHRVLFETGARGEDNSPREATVEVVDQEGYTLELYNLEFN